MTDHVKFFRDTAPYINMHRGKTFVIAVPGEGIGHDNFPHIVQDIALLTSLGVRVVLAYGAEPQIDARLGAEDLAPRHCGGVRIVDSAAMAVVRGVVGSIRIDIEALLSMGVANSPMHGACIRVVSGNFMVAKPMGVRGGVDFHLTGEVRRIDRDGIRRQLDDGAIVLLPPIAYSPTGEAFSLAVEEVATQAAIALGAEKLILFGAHTGVATGAGQLQKIISLADVPSWLTHLTGEPALSAALLAGYRACLNGVPRSHLISHAEDGALLGELFTREGAGTLILRDGAEIIRQASIDDVGGILDLIRPLEEQGVLVKRSRELLETEISRFHVLVDSEGMVVSCAALYPFAGSQSAELACVATHPDFHNRGLASRMLAHLEQLAREELGLRQLFVLTTRAAHWFLEKGFKPSTLDALPAEKADLYNYQRRSKIFQKDV